MLVRSLVSSGRSISLTSARFVQKGPESAPPQRFISVSGHIIRYLILAFGAMSYPTYVMFNLDNYRPRPNDDLSPEMQELIEERKARRAEGKQPILQDWPIIHQKKISNE